MPRARLESGELPALLWRCVGFALLASAASDLLIVLDQAIGDGSWRLAIVGLFSSLNLLLLGLLGLSSELSARESWPEELERVDRASSSGTPPQADVGDERVPRRPVEDDGIEGAVDESDDAVLLARLDELMETRRLYLDPDLTLARLARRLGIPAKSLSAAINRGHGENVSRRVNRYRIAHARDALRAGSTVTAALHDSGFATKSNFNREFLRIEGVSPSEWRRRVLADPAQPPPA